MHPAGAPISVHLLGHGSLRRARSPLRVCTLLGCYTNWAHGSLRRAGSPLHVCTPLGCQYLYIYWAHGSQILSILIIWASWPRNVLHLFRLVNNPKAPQPRFIELKWALGTKAWTRLAKQSWEHQVCDPLRLSLGGTKALTHLA